MKRLATVVILLAAVAIFSFWWTSRDNTPTGKLDNSNNQKTNNSHNGTSGGTKTFDTSLYSTTDPASIWVIINKSHPLSPKTYVPADLVLPNVKQRVPGTQEMKMRAAAAKALESMFAAGEKDGIKLLISTAYRSYSYQSVLYNQDLRTHGQAAADQLTARPGYSEHQSGLAVDIRAQNGVCSVQQCFGNTAEGKWLAANAYKYGFLLRYPKDKESITGYEYEPWHFRYVGAALASELHQRGIETLEEFFNVSGGTVFR